MLNKSGNIVTKTIYNSFLRRDLNYGFSNGGVRDAYHPYWTNNFAKGFDLRKRMVEQPQLPISVQTSHRGSWPKEVRQSEFNNSQLSWWIILGIIGGAIGLWSFTEAKAEEKEDGEHFKINEENYVEIIKRLKDNSPRFFLIEVQIKLSESQLKLLYEAIKYNGVKGFIVWDKNQDRYDYVELINRKIRYNNSEDDGTKKNLEYLEKALQMIQALYSDNRPALANSLNDIGLAYRVLGDKKKSLECCEKSLQMRQALYHGNHLDVASSLDAVALMYSGNVNEYYDSGKTLEYRKQAYSIVCAVLGNDHPRAIELKRNIEYHDDRYLGSFFSSKGNFSEILFREGCNKVGAECRTIIWERGSFEETILQVKEKIQEKVLGRIEKRAAFGGWQSEEKRRAKLLDPAIYKSVDIFSNDWGVSYIKKKLGSLNNEANVETAKMLCFEAINLGIMRSFDKPYSYHLVQEFTKAHPELVKKIAVQHPEYFVDGSIVEACIRAMPGDASFKEHLHKCTGVGEFKAQKREGL